MEMLMTMRLSSRSRPGLARTIVLLAILVAGVCAQAALAQVTVAPTAVFLDDGNRFGTVYISNNSDSPQQVELSFQFGYPAADSTGNLYMEYGDSTAAREYSLVPYLRAFPQQFSLPPGESQVVRVVANPLSDKSDGMYWTRLITASEPQVEEVATQTDSVQARVTFRIRQVTSVLFRKGSPSVQMSLSDVSAAADTGVVEVMATLEKQGRAPFLGTAHIRLLTDSGTEVANIPRAIAVYFDMRRRFEVPLPEEAGPGNYRVELTLNTERNDIPQEFHLTMNEVSESATLQIE